MLACDETAARPRLRGQSRGGTHASDADGLWRQYVAGEGLVVNEQCA